MNNNKEINKGVIIASDYRGNYILKDGWVYNEASEGYGNCIFGEFNYFVKSMGWGHDYILTPAGKQVLEAYNSCKKPCKCSYCKKYNEGVKCLLKGI